MKPLYEMDERELFEALTTGEDVLLRAQIEHIAQEWLAAQGRSKPSDGDSLREMVEWYRREKQAAKDK